MARSRRRSSVDEMDVGGSATSEYENCGGPSFSPLNLSRPKKSTRGRSLRSAQAWGGKQLHPERSTPLARNDCGPSSKPRRRHEVGRSNKGLGASLDRTDEDTSQCPRIRASAIRCGASTRKIVRITGECDAQQGDSRPGRSEMAGWHSPLSDEELQVDMGIPTMNGPIYPDYHRTA